METKWRDLLICLAALAILAIIALPSLLLNHPDTRSEERASTPVEKEAARVRYQELLVREPVHPVEGANPGFWLASSKQWLADQVKRPLVPGKAKNVVFFLGDGMGVSTLTTARVHKGQQRAGMVGGEQEKLVFEQFPHLALVRTYCYDTTVADSACSATSYLCGVKGNYETVGVSAEVKLGDCAAQQVPENRVSSLLAWAQEKGKATGVVTTDSLTGASPAGTYAHAADRDWENDELTPAGCEDIASQLVSEQTGRQFKVILGGGDQHFRRRGDGRDLTKEWMEGRKGGKLVTNREELNNANASNTEFLFGLFADDEMSYRLDVDEKTNKEPSLAEMTAKAVELLEGTEQGFVLFVESALIDKAHHEGWARKATQEVLELERAVEVVLNMTDPLSTLTIVTADHSHGITLSGYPKRGTDIFGYDPAAPEYLSLMYATGPGHKGENWNLLEEPKLGDKDFRFPSTVHRDSAAHQGEEVALYAIGPGAQYFQGLLQQYMVPHILSYASCIGDGPSMCDQ